MNQLLQLMVSKGGSDLHLSVGRAPTVRFHGKLKALNTPPLTADDTLAFMKSITPDRFQQELNELGGADFSLLLQTKLVSVFLYLNKNGLSLVLRQIPSKLLNFDEIGLPHHVKTLLSKPRGLIFSDYLTGCGKQQL